MRVVETITDKDGVEHDAWVLRYRKRELAVQGQSRSKSAHERVIEFLAEDNHWNLAYIEEDVIRLKKKDTIVFVSLTREGHINEWWSIVDNIRFGDLVIGRSEKKPEELVDYLSGCEVDVV